MSHSTRNRRLDEVKAILRRLQHISDEPHSGPAGDDATHLFRAPSRRVAIAAVVITAALVLTMLGTYAFLSFRPPAGSTVRLPAGRAAEPKTLPNSTMAPRPNAPVPPAPSTTVLQGALRHMAGGRIQIARSELARIEPEGSADVAWALARSYDPNFLSTVPKADAAPDVPEATRWYRTWYTLAVKEGLVADSVSLERIIRSMR